MRTRSAPSTPGVIADALWRGLRFQGAALGLLLSPALSCTGGRRPPDGGRCGGPSSPTPSSCRWRSRSSRSPTCSTSRTAGARLTYEATSYFNLSMVPILAGAFALRPYLTVGSLVTCLGLVWLTARAMRGLMRFSLPVAERPGAGGEHPRPAGMDPGPDRRRSRRHAERGRADRRLPNLDEPPRERPVPRSDVLGAVERDGAVEAGVPVLRRGIQRRAWFAASCSSTRRSAASREYPLLRRSPGTEQGNRKNVVLFILESWTARHVGALGGRPDVTPFFDALAGAGSAVRPILRQRAAHARGDLLDPDLVPEPAAAAHPRPGPLLPRALADAERDPGRGRVRHHLRPRPGPRLRRPEWLPEGEPVRADHRPPGLSAIRAPPGRVVARLRRRGGHATRPPGILPACRAGRSSASSTR